jgi:uncharacterized protein (TIGR03435 family)
MLLLPALVVWGPRARLPLLRSAANAPVALLLPSAITPVSSLPAEPSSHPVKPRPSDGGSEWLWAVYFAGVLVFLIRLGIGVARVRKLLRGSFSCASPVTVGWLRPKVILPAESSQWPRAKLDAVLAHEREHARRRDPLWQLLALLNRAVFWFHPLAWWLEREISALAEEACDAAVLARGYDAGDYSECLLDLAKSVKRVGMRVGALGVAMPGVGLERRIRLMLSGAPTPGVSRLRIACTAALCTIAAAIFATGTLVRAQSSAKGRLEFEVASVRPSNPDAGFGAFKSKDGRGGGGLPPTLSHGRFSFSSNLFGMIVRAYAIKGCRPAFQASCASISGGPDWIKKDRFDIRAKTPDGIPEYTFQQFFDGQAPQIQLMLQALLADRFNLRVHHEKTQMPVYALTIAKKGPKLTRSGPVETVKLPDGSSRETRGVVFQPVAQPDGERQIRLSAKNASMQDVVDVFSSILERPVLDRTGLKGEFNFAMTYAADGDQPLLSLGGPELFTAFQEQAGLKLQATKAAVDVLVIDHAEKPSEN